jgi:uncharacterized OB-fold protein
MSLLVRGEVYSYTLVERDQALPDYVALAPYYQVLVKLVDGPMITSRLTDLGDEQVYIGMIVEMTTRLLGRDEDGRGLLKYGPAFRPIIGE